MFYQINRLFYIANAIEDLWYHKERIVGTVHTPCCSRGWCCNLFSVQLPKGWSIADNPGKIKNFIAFSCFGAPTRPLWALLCYLLGCTITNNCKFLTFVSPPLIHNIFIWLKLLVNASGHMSLNLTGNKKINSIDNDSVMQFSLDVLRSIYSNVCFTQSIKNIRIGLPNYFAVLFIFNITKIDDVSKKSSVETLSFIACMWLSVHVVARSHQWEFPGSRSASEANSSL